MVFLRLILLAWPTSIRRAGHAFLSRPHFSPGQTSHAPLLKLWSSCYFHFPNGFVLWGWLWSPATIMLPTDTLLLASSFILVLRSSIIHHNLIPGPLEQNSSLFFVMWSQSVTFYFFFFFATIIGLWAMSPTSFWGTRTISSTYVIPRTILLHNWCLINVCGENI